MEEAALEVLQAMPQAAAVRVFRELIRQDPELLAAFAQAGLLEVAVLETPEVQR